MTAMPLRPVAALLLAALLGSTAPAQRDASFEQRQQDWVWQPLLDCAPPRVADESWPRDPLDAFVLSRLEQHGLRPAAPAEPAVWLRRVWFDLVGLPPEPEAIAAFEADPSPAARARVVDQLLGSPHFGERWARHWLDVVRYAESLGHEFDFPIPNAWRYRDYVVRALNADVPFREFAIEHLAGDLLPAPRLDPVTGENESVQATAFWWFAEQTHGPVDPKKHEADRIDNQIDVATKAFLGVTVACARCHDHKFDAIRSADYYALYGFVASSRYVQQPVFSTRAEDAAETLAAHRALAALAEPGADAGPCDAAQAGEAHAFARVGDAFEPGWRGPFVTGVHEHAVLLRTLPGTWSLSAALDTARDGALLSATFALEQPWLHVEVAGHGARVQLVVDGLHLVRDPLYSRLHRETRSEEPHWLSLDVRSWIGRRAHLQVLDQRAADLADPSRNRKLYPDDAWIAVRRVVHSADQAPPPVAGASTTTALPREDPTVEAALQRWQRAVLALPPPATVPAMADGDGEDAHVFLRGDHRQPGEPAPRRFLAALDGDAAMKLPAGSGRLELARRMFGDDVPMPARVLVNRVWHHLFGRGLVRTVDNFGHLGEPPLHRELLDRLARDVVAGGWSTKRLIRRIVSSATYGMDSVADAGGGAETADPDNRLLHRHAIRRLQGEVLRDAMLAFAGRLDGRLGGPPVPVPLHPDEDARGKPDESGPVDGDGRRSIYLAVCRNFLSEFQLAFDLPTPFSTVGARSVANVPAQALALLNDPFVHAMSLSAAEALLADGPPDEAAAVGHWFLAGLGRRASADEVRLCRQFLGARRREDGDVQAWAALAHVLINHKEFRYLR
jgi:hypothetical protein